MSRYEIVLYWSGDDGAYVADVPELPGCMGRMAGRMRRRSRRRRKPLNFG